MHDYDRKEIRRRALRAAAAVAVCLGGPGCGGDAASFNPQPTDGAALAADAPATADSATADSAAADTATADAAVADSVAADTAAAKADVAQGAEVAQDTAGSDTAGPDAVAADVGPDLASADAADAGHKCDINTMGDQEYIDCCKAVNWDWNQGCMAWGPPAPPAFEVA